MIFSSISVFVSFTILVRWGGKSAILQCRSVVYWWHMTIHGLRYFFECEWCFRCRVLSTCHNLMHIEPRFFDLRGGNQAEFCHDMVLMKEMGGITGSKGNWKRVDICVLWVVVNVHPRRVAGPSGRFWCNRKSRMGEIRLQYEKDWLCTYKA